MAYTVEIKRYNVERMVDLICATYPDFGQYTDGMVETLANELNVVLGIPPLFEQLSDGTWVIAEL